MTRKFLILATLQMTPPGVSTTYYMYASSRPLQMISFEFLFGIGSMLARRVHEAHFMNSCWHASCSNVLGGFLCTLCAVIHPLPVWHCVHFVQAEDKIRSLAVKCEQLEEELQHSLHASDTATAQVRIGKHSSEHYALLGAKYFRYSRSSVPGRTARSMLQSHSTG